MKTQMLCAAIGLAALFIVGCFGGSSIIKGSVVMRTDSEAHINLGSEDGIQVNDTLSMYREERGSTLSSRTVRVGKVRVVRILDASHAAVAILSGNVREHDSVEKKIP